MSTNDNKSFPGPSSTRKERLRERAHKFKEMVNSRSEKRYEMYLEMKLSSPMFTMGCSMTDALQGNETFLNCYRAYKEHNGGRTAQRTERFRVHEKLADVIGEKVLKIDALSESFDDIYYCFVGIVHQMGFELVNLDSDSTAAVIQVFEDEMRENGHETFISQNFSADVINVTEFPIDSTEDSTTKNFKRIVLQSEASSKTNEDNLSVLRINAGEKETTRKKTGTENIEKDLSFLTQLQNKGFEKIILHNENKLSVERKPEVIPAESVMVANLIFNHLDCASKFVLKYVMQGAFDTIDLSTCEAVQVQHI